MKEPSVCTVGIVFDAENIELARELFQVNGFDKFDIIYQLIKFSDKWTVK